MGGSKCSISRSCLSEIRDLEKRARICHTIRMAPVVKPTTAIISKLFMFCKGVSDPPEAGYNPPLG